MASSKLDRLKWRHGDDGSSGVWANSGDPFIRPTPGMALAADWEEAKQLAMVHNSQLETAFAMGALSVQNKASEEGKLWELVDKDGCVTTTARPLVDLAHVMARHHRMIARPAEPKHVHRWSGPFVRLEGHPVERRCACGAVQVAHWTDAP